MKHHEYYNTIWTHRDQEFWWDGIKSGAIVSAIVTSGLWVCGIELFNMIKTKTKKDDK